ncbi:hypothetical protein Tco_0276400 [Tanacetum coccineum]
MGGSLRQQIIGQCKYGTSNAGAESVGVSDCNKGDCGNGTNYDNEDSTAPVIALKKDAIIGASIYTPGNDLNIAARVWFLWIDYIVL